MSAHSFFEAESACKSCTVQEKLSSATMTEYSIIIRSSRRHVLYNIAKHDKIQTKRLASSMASLQVK